MIVHETLSAAIDQRKRLVVAPIADTATLDWATTTNVADHADMIELRLDALTGALDAAEAFAKAIAIPVLITARRPDEGAASILTPKQRAGLFERFLPVASALDIEIQSLGELSAVVQAAKQAGALLVTSAHNFEAMPDARELASLIEQASDHADIVKIAATPKNLGDVFDLAGLVTSNSASVAMSTMGMGEFGRLSRLVCAQAGSVLNYGYLSEPNAPGQWPSSQLRSLIGDLLE